MSDAGDVRASTTLSLAGHALPARDAVSHTLAQFTQLRRLDVSNILPSEEWPRGLDQLQWLVKAVRLSRKAARGSEQLPLAKRLTWLNLAGNSALGSDSLEGLDVLSELCAFPYLPELNTLVLSHNQLSALPPTLPSSVPGLKKLSVSHNCLSSEGIPDFSVCSHLREVRLNSNAGVGVLPAHVSTWGRGVDGGAPGLVLLDVSECGLQDWMGLQPLLAHRARDTERHGLVNLCVKGNKVAAEPNYRDRLCASIPSLRILDQVRLQPKAQDDAPPASAAVEAIEQRRDDHAAAPSSTKGRKAGRREQAAKRDRPSEEAGETPVHKEWQAPGAGDAPASKKRKRSGRGPKKSRAAAEPASPEPAAARLASAAESPHEPVAERRASSAAAELPASSHDRVSRKKTRRKKGHKQIEMDMGTSTQGAVSEARRASPEPPARSSDAPPSGVFQVQEHRSHTPRVPVSLGRADVELDGW